MSKIADGDDNADYRQIIGIATPPQTIPIQTIALCLGVERVEEGGLLGWERRGIQRLLCEFSASLDEPRSEDGLWRDTIGD